MLPVLACDVGDWGLASTQGGLPGKSTHAANIRQNPSAEKLIRVRRAPHRFSAKCLPKSVKIRQNPSNSVKIRQNPFYDGRNFAEKLFRQNPSKSVKTLARILPKISSVKIRFCMGRLATQGG